MARDYTVATMGAMEFYQSWADGEHDPASLREAQVNLPTAGVPEGESVVVLTRGERGDVHRMRVPTLEAAKFRARCFVEWDGGDSTFVARG